MTAGRAWGHLLGLLTAIQDAPASISRLDDAQKMKLGALVAELETLRAKRDFPSFAKAPQSTPLVAAAAAAVGRPAPDPSASTRGGEGCCGGGGCGSGAGDGDKPRDCGRSACGDEQELWQRCVRFLHEAQLAPLAEALPKNSM